MTKLKIEDWALERITLYENNSKLHPEWQVDQIANSIEEFGMIDPVAIDEHGVLLEGEGRVLAALKRNDPTIPAIQIFGLTEAQKVAYRLAHNKINKNTEFDWDLLQKDIEFLQGEDYDLELTGFSDDDLSFGSEEEGGDRWEEQPETPPSVIEDDANGFAHECPKCGFKFDDKD